VKDYKRKYPNAKVVGHRDLSPDLNGDGKITPNEWVKLCPCFNSITEYI
jgi:N-acetyl-anhydromuramyl-L-alanine amidase AmpD